MSNRTDFDVVAQEIAHDSGLDNEDAGRIETELHNAFVAGQESKSSPSWTADRPTAGKWWVSLAPNHRRNPCLPVRWVEVRPGLVISSDDFCLADDQRLVGALWLPRETPADPFKEMPSDGR